MASAQSLLWVGLACALLVGTARAQPTGGSSGACAAAMLAIRDGEPLQFARVVARFGDQEVLALLAPDGAGTVRLAAIRATRWLRAPEYAMPRLVSELAGRDSLLAPAAARAAVDIAGSLDADALGRRESTPGELDAVLEALRRASENPHLRAELRMMAQRAATLLEAAGVPSARARAPT